MVGGRVLAAALAEFEEKSPRPLVMISAMLVTKDAIGFFSSFKGLAKQISAVTIPGHEAMRAAEDVAANATLAGLSASTSASVEQALATLARQQWPVAPRIIICGSLYLAGEVLRLNGNEPV
jgi:dihydrofolate synthase/folylpolyglutamate synthase